MGDSYSVVTTLASWVLWRLCHDQPDSLIAGGGGGGSCTKSLEATPKSGIRQQQIMAKQITLARQIP